MGSRRYTDQQFRDAVAGPEVRTIADLCRALGILPRGGNYRTVRATAARLGVDLPSSRRRRPARRDRRGAPSACTDDELLAALRNPAVDSLRALCTAVGLRPHSTTYRRLRERAAALGRPIPDRWSKTGPRDGRPECPLRFDPEALACAVALARTRREVLELLGVDADASGYRRLAHQLHHEHLSTEHLSAHAYRRTPLERVLVAGREVTTSKLRQRLIDEGLLEAACGRCRRTAWEREAIPLELDHIDGDRLNNRLENLRLLCPNCHALTPTYRGRNIGRSARPSNGS